MLEKIIYPTIQQLKDFASVNINKSDSISQINTNGLSAANFYKFSDKYFLKEVDLSEDWLSLRSADTGREFYILRDIINSPLWDIVDNPYIAIAKEHNKYALLMNDLSKQFNQIQKTNIPNELNIKTLAKIHASFWSDTTLTDKPYLLNLQGYFEMLGANDKYQHTQQKIGLMVLNGWKKVEDLIPKETMLFLHNYKVNAKRFSHLPCTFIHGDFRPTNFAYDSKGDKLTLIDFAFSGFAPCTVDLFWYIATTTWLGVDYDETINLYKYHLENEIGKLPESVWNELLSVGILSAC
ncbi:phosphotransferase [Clostridium sp.]|jgi:serine/threonine protein kinase|uniref:phosphotransferase n=1 Tax=Clostridium sp. TaxID=1506 RepID=UPI003EEE8D90